MHCSNELIGLPVFSNNTKLKIGIVEGVVYIPKSKGFFGILVNCGTIISRKNVVLNKEIVKITKKRVIINEINTPNKEEIKSGIQHQMLGKRVFIDNGNEIGVVSELLLDTENYKVEGFELSESFFDDIYKGRSIISGFDEIEVENDSIIVPQVNSFRIRKSDGGLRNIFKLE